MTVLHADCLDVMGGLPEGSVDAIVTDPPYGTGRWTRRGGGPSHSVEPWDAWDTAWLDQAIRVCRGPIAFFCPASRFGDAIRHAEGAGQEWRMMAWCKPDPMPTFTRQIAYGMEPVIVLRHKLAKGGKDWCEASTPRKGRDRDASDHPHQKPLRVIAWLVAAMSDPDALVMDPFAGSGTTGVACLKSGRRCLLVERDSRHVETIRKRLREASTPLFAQAS